MSENKTDVRALIWVNPLVFKYADVANLSGIGNTNLHSILSADALRKKPNMEKKVCLNVLGHPVGAVHLKMVICGSDTSVSAYVSGLDFDYLRVDGHPHKKRYPKIGWHDVVSKFRVLQLKIFTITLKNFGMRTYDTVNFLL